MGGGEEFMFEKDGSKGMKKKLFLNLNIIL